LISSPHAAVGRTLWPSVFARSRRRDDKVVQPRRFDSREEDVSEPISPELVLVDSELARAERARMLERERLGAPAAQAMIPPPVEPAPVEGPTVRVPQVPSNVRWETPSAAPRKRLTPTLLTASLMANAILIAVVIAGARGDEPSPALPVALTTTTAQRESPAVPTTPEAKKQGHTRRPKTQRRNRPGRGSAVLHTTSGEVERKILNLVIQSPRGKLPPRLIDPKTGLAKNSLQAVCRLSARRSFLCIVRPARHRPTEGLYVRYRPMSTGRKSLTWYPYRRG
jgi:hypothetical protein